MIQQVIDALRAVGNERFFETERGFQGAFQAHLRDRVGDLVPPEAIVEEEYQKRIKIHGIRRRPDVIIHVPAQTGADRRVGNFAVFALKLRATATEARGDFDALDAMFRALHYPFGGFINIGTDRTHGDVYAGPYPDRIHMFAAWQVEGTTRVRHARHQDGQLVEEG